MPSRGCLMSGYHSQQSGMEQSAQAKPAQWVKFLPQYLAPQGYRCYHSGKWHVAGTMPLRDTGFHHSYYLQDQDRFFSPTRHYLDDQPLPRVNPGDGYYATTEIADRGIAWLKGHQTADPFFLYLAFTSPHFPLHALEDDIRRFREGYLVGWDVVREQRRRRGVVRCELAPLEPDVRPPWNTSEAELMRQIGPGEVTRVVPWNTLTREQREFQATKMAIHAAMVYRMDVHIGRVLDQLRAMQALDDTVILFLSDNGASAEQLIRADGHDPKAAPGSWASHLCLGSGWASAANSPFRRSKSWVHEGGIASPMIVHWPNGIKARGELRRTPCHFVDMLPTLADLAGVDAPKAHAGAPPLPGRSMAPAFAKDRTIEKDYLFFHHANTRALRQGDWKLVAAGTEGPWELYDLARDRGETRDLSKRDAARVEAMAREWQRLQTEFTRWPSAARANNLQHA
jgi:arylsulfatase